MGKELTGLQVYKFGGASVKDAAAILNLCRIVRDFGPSGPLLIVVSAMGKTTNALEEIYDLAYHGRDYSGQLDALKAYHQLAHEELYQQLPDYAQNFGGEHSPITVFDELSEKLAQLPATGNYDEGYDQIVSYGETISAHIVADALASFEPSRLAFWYPASNLIHTDSTWREGYVDWATTEQNVREIAQGPFT